MCFYSKWFPVLDSNKGNAIVWHCLSLPINWTGHNDTPGKLMLINPAFLPGHGQSGQHLINCCNHSWPDQEVDQWRNNNSCLFVLLNYSGIPLVFSSGTLEWYSALASHGPKLATISSWLYLPTHILTNVSDQPARTQMAILPHNK